MRIADEIEVLKATKSISKDLIPAMISEAYEKNEQGKATEKDKFLLGLRYPEFYSHSDRDMLGAYHRSENYRKRIGITMDWLMIVLAEDYGLF